MSIARAAASGLVLLAALTGAAFAEARRFEFRYDVAISGIEAGSGPVDVFVPLPVEDAGQFVLETILSGTLEGRIEREPVYGNRFFRGRVERATGETIEVSLRAVVERRAESHPAPAHVAALSDAERVEHERFLAASDTVVVGHAILEPILAEIRAAAASSDKADIARAIYDWVVDNVEYKKIGTGWGNGDTFWACSERYGNCTDFHALLISLARTEGIPARFEMGFPIPDDSPAGEIAGYHCWVELYLPETGWFPIDASEASRHPERRELFFGTHRADRLHMTTGRDLRLGDAHRDRELSYFVYPYVEVDGKRYEGEIERRFSYRDLPVDPER